MLHTINEIMEFAAKEYGNVDAIRYKVKKDVIEAKSYTQLKTDSDQVAQAIAGLGEMGHHIAVIGPSTYEWIYTYLGIVTGGNVAVPVDVSLPAADVCELLDRADVTILIYDSLRSDVAELAAANCPKLKHIVCMQEKEGAVTLSQLQQQYAENTIEAAVKPEDLCTIMFTSGTTGKSKGVMLTHRNLANNATALDMKLPPRTVLLSVLPIHHAYCLTMDVLKGLSLGSILCINDSLIRMAKNMKLFAPDMILMVPLMIESIAKKLEDAAALPAEIVKKEVFGENLHTISSGGAYLNPAMITLFEKYGIALLQGYGMTECSPVISTNMHDNRKENSVGHLMPNCEAKVVDNEILVKGSSVMMGYYQMPEETKEALEDGWLHTGDLGYVDEDGFIFLTGRKKNLIITKNGENVSPEEIENKLSEERLVAEVMVREKDGIIEAEIFPDLEYAQKTELINGEEDQKKLETVLQETIDTYNRSTPAHKRIYHLIVRMEEFEKTPSKKIKRF